MLSPKGSINVYEKNSSALKFLNVMMTVANSTKKCFDTKHQRFKILKHGQKMRQPKRLLLKILIVILPFINFILVHPSWAKDNSPAATDTAIALKTTTPSITPTPAVKTTGVKKDFKWFFKNGCNCPQCKAFKQQQADDQERLKNNFLP